MAWSLPLAPVTACLLIGLSVLHQGGAPYRHEEAGLGESNLLALLAADYHQEHNDISALTLEWTKRSSSTSSISSFAPDKAN